MSNRFREKAERENALVCNADHIQRFTDLIDEAGLRLQSSASDTQLTTLPKVLRHLGPRGANTYELVGAGYLRPSARVADLQDDWEITSTREDCFGPDGIFHKGIARYYLIGKRRKEQAQEVAEVAQ